jgi:hypothetical protein
MRGFGPSFERKNDMDTIANINTMNSLSTSDRLQLLRVITQLAETNAAQAAAIADLEDRVTALENA